MSHVCSVLKLSNRRCVFCLSERGPQQCSVVCIQSGMMYNVELSAYAHLAVYIALLCGCAGDGDRGRDRDRGGFFGRRDGSQDGSEGAVDDGPSRADVADDWGAQRKFVPSDRNSSFGGGGGFGSRREEGKDEGEDAGIVPDHMSHETRAVIGMQHSLPGILSLLHLCLCCSTMMTCSFWLHALRCLC